MCILTKNKMSKLSFKSFVANSGFSCLRSTVLKSEANLEVCSPPSGVQVFTLGLIHQPSIIEIYDISDKNFLMGWGLVCLFSFSFMFFKYLIFWFLYLFSLTWSFCSIHNYMSRSIPKSLCVVFNGVLEYFWAPHELDNISVLIMCKLWTWGVTYFLSSIWNLK